MDPDLAAARHAPAPGAGSMRARSVINRTRPFWPAESLLGSADPRLAGLAGSCAPSVARLVVDFQGTAIAVGTAWPVTTQGSAQSPGRSVRFLTAGHMLKIFRKEATGMAHAADLDPDGIRPGAVIFPDQRKYDIARWVCAAALDVAVFDIGLAPGQQAPQGLLLAAPDSAPPPVPQTAPQAAPRAIAVIGYPLQPGVALYSGPYGDYVGTLFLSTGTVAPGGAAPGSFLHDAATLKGCSGSPVFDLDTGAVIGLHYEGSRAGTVLATPGRGDWNDALTAAAIMRGWLAEIVSMQREGPPADPAIMSWGGGAEPRPQEMAADLLALAVHDRGAGAPGGAPAPAGDRPDSRDAPDPRCA